LTTQETTAFDVAALAVEPHAVLSHASEASATAPQANEPPKHAAPPPRSPVHEFLTKLGILTTERPVLIGGGSLVGAFVLALALVGATRVAEPARKAAALAASASAKPTTRPITAATPSPSSVKLEPIITAVKPPPIEAKSTARAQKGITDPALTAAVGHLAAGRVAEASASYRSLSSRPEGGDVYATVSSLLAQRTASCAAGPAQLNHCPEILK
jgi:hypothetical protein